LHVGHASECTIPATFPRIVALVAAALLLAIAGCGSPQANPTQLLAEAKAKLDSTSALHFELTSSDVQGTGPLITGGSGDAQRPDRFSGRLSVELGGFAVSVEVVSVNGTFYVKLPTDTGFTPADPSAYGFGDPALFLDPHRGLSSLLLMCSSSSVGDDDRYNGELLHEVSCTLPGRPVASLLTSADPGQDVAATFGIDSGNTQLRRVVLTGPFFSKSKRSTFMLVLDKYGENVSIVAPAGA
jgi:lipoprotein LprG